MITPLLTFLFGGVQKESHEAGETIPITKIHHFSFSSLYTFLPFLERGLMLK